MHNWLKKHIDPVVPLFSIVPLLSCFALNMLVYSGTMILCEDWHHYNLTTSFDEMVPLIPEWMYIYFGCYLFWVVNYIMVARIHRNEQEQFYRFVMTDMMSRLVCALFYIGFPTTNIRPEVTGDGFSVWMLTFLYGIDQPTNLFPSIHCLVSWLCYAGIRGSRKIPRWYRALSCVFALVVAASTQFTKQHYIADVFAGILLAELLFQINKKIPAYRIVERFFTWFNRKIHMTA